MNNIYFSKIKTPLGELPIRDDCPQDMTLTDITDVIDRFFSIIDAKQLKLCRCKDKTVKHDCNHDTTKTIALKTDKVGMFATHSANNVSTPTIQPKFTIKDMPTRIKDRPAISGLLVDKKVTEYTDIGTDTFKYSGRKMRIYLGIIRLLYDKYECSKMFTIVGISKTIEPTGITSSRGRSLGQLAFRYLKYMIEKGYAIEIEGLHGRHSYYKFIKCPYNKVIPEFDSNYAREQMRRDIEYTRRNN